ncbi:protein BCCIP homolog [Orussus abietinus]|uniref:protein BCCIP homolog n=1 Tax=Orussus abietinus TaxID=222816 RepID=UPI0006266EE5|nr:protein BCCIP homolog [Orussus abietinus]
MAAPGKKREIALKTGKNVNEDEASSFSESDENENENGAGNEQGMEIQVDFEGRNPQDPDYHGIKMLLQQLFLKAHLDLAALTDLIISQNYVGSVVKQSDDGEDDGEDISDEDDYVNGVFGITTVVNLSDRQNLPCIQQLRSILKQLASDNASDATNAMIKRILEDDSSTLGLLINERFVNMPAQISVPLLENLMCEIQRAVSKKMPFEFTYYILICKLYKMEKIVKKTEKSKRRGATEEPEIFWSNPEEEIFAKEATFSFEFCVEKEADSGLVGKWGECDDEMTPYRRVLLFEASKLQPIIDKIKRFVS